jgi:hypothetical protein
MLAFADGKIAAKTDNGKAKDKNKNKNTGDDKSTDASQQGKLL